MLSYRYRSCLPSQDLVLDIISFLVSLADLVYIYLAADLAQLVEQLPRKEQVAGSSPVVGTI